MYKVIEDMISVKTLLREALIEAEFDTGGHTIERIKERLNSISDNDLSKEIKEEVITNLDKIRETDFARGKSFAVMIGSFEPNPESRLYLRDRGTGFYRIMSTGENDVMKDSTGDQFWMIIRNNIIKTFFLRKSYQTRIPERNAENLKVDKTFYNPSEAAKVFSIEAVKKAERDVNRVPAGPKVNKGRGIININGVNWKVDKKNRIIFKKNNQAERYDVDEFMKNFDELTQQAIKSLL